MPAPGRPLEGILVVDLSRHLPGPFAARMLANLGARVVKVEEPSLGDPVRQAPPFRSGRSLLAEALLSGVESIALDLKMDGGRFVLDRLLETSDVLLETFRPGTLSRFGLAPEALREERPELVVCSLSGWGASGPLVARAGHDLTYQARAGALAATGAVPNLPAADLMGAWSAVAAVSAALFARERTGEGAWIDASLFDSAVVGNVTNLTSAMENHEVPAAGPLTGALPCYRIYSTQDGALIAVGALEKKFWRSLCEEVGRADLVSAQYRSDAASHRLVASLFESRTAEEWQALFERLDVPGEIVATPDAALASEHAAARGLEVVRRGGVPFPARLDGGRPRAGSDFPRVGEHTRQIVAEFCPDRAAMSRRERMAAGIGPRLSLRRSLSGWIGGLKG